MNSLIKTKIYLILLFILLTSIQSKPSKKDININELIKETQILINKKGEINFAWWIPIEYWETSLNNSKMEKEKVKEFIKVLKPYTLFAIVKGKTGLFGTLKYQSEDSIKNTLSLKGEKGEKYFPIESKNLEPELIILLSTMKPILKNILGELGNNMNFYVFKDLTKRKKRISNPFAKGTVVLNLGIDTFKWNTPLSSLLPLKICPVDNKKMNGTWDYCPWHGEKLKPQE